MTGRGVRMRKTKVKSGEAGQVTDELRVKRRVSVRGKRIRYLALVLLVLVTAFYAVWSILFVMTGKGEDIRLAFLRQGSIDRTTSCAVIFLDNGTAVQSPSAGLLLPLLDEGQRVSKDAELALIVSPGQEREVHLYRDAKEAYDARLFVVSGFADPARFQSPRSPADSRIREAIRAMIDLDAVSGIGSLYYGTQRIRHELEATRSEAALFAGTDEELLRLADECAGLLATLRADPRTVRLRAPVAGEVCFSRSDLPSLDSIWKEMQAEMQAVPLRWAGTPNRWHDAPYTLVAPGERVASIRRFSGMNAATYLDNATADLLAIEKGDRVNLSDPETGLFLRDCLVERAEKIGPGRLYLFACDDLTCLWPRQVAMSSATLITGQTSGLRVPLASLFTLDQETQSTGLRCIRSGVTETVEVEILANDGTYALIRSKEEERPVREADLYVVNPWSAEDGQLID